MPQGSLHGTDMPRHPVEPAARWLLLTCALLSLLPGPTLARTPDCVALGETYEAPSSAPPVAGQPRVRYSLRIESLPRGSEGSAVADLWRFTLRDARTGRRLSELRLHHAVVSR